MKLSERQLRDWRRLRDSQTSDFQTLARIARLDPSRDFKGADLAEVDFGAADLRAYDFEGADLRGANLSRARVAMGGLRGALLAGAKLPPSFNLTSLQVEITTTIIEHLRQQHHRALVTAPTGVGISRVVGELLHQFVVNATGTMALVLAPSKSMVQQLFTRLAKSDIGPVDLLSNLGPGALAARTYVADYQSCLRSLQDPDSFAHGPLRNGAFTHLVGMAANQAPLQRVMSILEKTAKLDQVVFLNGVGDIGSPLAAHFAHNDIFEFDVEGARAAGFLPPFKVMDLRAVVAGSPNSAPPKPDAVIRRAMRDFRERLDEAELLLEKSLVLCASRAQAEEAAEELNRLYGERGMVAGPDSPHDVATTTDSRELAEYLLGEQAEPFILCCTTHALDSDSYAELAAIAVLVKTASGRTRNLWELAGPRRGDADPLRVFDYGGAAVRSSRR